MLRYNEVKVVKVDTRETYYDEKKKKSVKYKKPIVKKTTVFSDNYIYDLGELYETMKFLSQKHCYSTLEVSFEVGIEY